MGGPLGKGHLQAVVVGLVLIGNAVDLRNVRELAKERPAGLYASRIAIIAVYAGTERWLVDVSEAQQLGAVVPHIGNLQGHIVRDRSLDGQCPGADIGRPHIWIHRLHVAGGRIRVRRSRYGQAVAALEIENTLGEDGRAVCSSRKCSTYASGGLSLP